LTLRHAERTVFASRRTWQLLVASMMDQMPQFNYFPSVPDFILTWRLCAARTLAVACAEADSIFCL
jgi:hypothetical protein